jgi:hypothetical protein
MIEIDLKTEFPPKWIGVRFNGSRKMVYRIDGEMGLVFHMNKITGESDHRWEHFTKFIDSKTSKSQ